MARLEHRADATDIRLDATDKKLGALDRSYRGFEDEDGRWNDGILQTVQRGQTRNRNMIAWAVPLIPLITVLLQYLLSHGAIAHGAIAGMPK